MREEFPFFEPHYLDWIRLGGRREEDAPRTLRGLEVGVDETRRILARHSNFLARYAPEDARSQHAAWLLGLAACAAPDAASPALFTQAMALGLSVEDLAELGVVCNSRACARFLNTQGVDWHSLRINAKPDAPLSTRNDLNTPVNALLDHVVDSARGSWVKKQVAPVVMVATSDLSQSPMAFMEGVLESQQFPPDWRVETQALGLADGKAYWLSHCIASGHLHMALVCLRQQHPVPQAVLDEALLAVAMSLGSKRIRLSEDDKALDRLAGYLHEQGANPDAAFEFGMAAMEKLLDQRLTDAVPDRATTREWAVRMGLEQRPGAAWEKVMFQSPWPAAPAADSWLDLVLARHQALLDNADDKPAARMMRRLIDQQSKLGFPALLEKLDPHIQRQGAQHECSLLRALVESKPGKRAQGALATEDLIPRLCRWGGSGDLLDAQVVGRHVHNFWKSAELAHAAQWIDPASREPFLDRVQLLCQAHDEYEKGFGPKEANKEALVLAFSALLSQASSPVMVPRAPRRSL